MMTVVKTVLQMNFRRNDGKNFALKLVDPREDITAADVQEVMELVQNLGFFVQLQDGGRMKDAKTIQTTTNDFDIIVVEG